MIHPPKDYRDIEETVMSNFDHRIDRAMERRLRQEKVICKYTAQDFCGDVWHERQFHCLVSTFGIPRQTFTAETLEELMLIVSNEYGSE